MELNGITVNNVAFMKRQIVAPAQTLRRKPSADLRRRLRKRLEPDVVTRLARVL
jgi:hypothetical protein